MFEDDFELPKLKSEPSPEVDSGKEISSNIIDATSSLKKEIPSVTEAPLITPNFNSNIEQTMEIPTLKPKEEKPLETSEEITSLDTWEVKEQLQNAKINIPETTSAFAFDQTLESAPRQEFEPLTIDNNQIPTIETAFGLPSSNEEAKTEDLLVNEPLIIDPLTTNTTSETNDIEELIIPPIFEQPVLEPTKTEEPLIEIPSSEEITFPKEENNDFTKEELETLTISLDPSELKAAIESQPEVEIPPTETFNPLPEVTTPTTSESVIYKTPESSYEFQVNNSPVNEPLPVFEEYIEEETNKKDPIILISTILIIASIIMAAAYFFITEGSGTPFAKKTTTTTTTIPTQTPNPEPQTWPVEGSYTESEKKVCPDVAVELVLKQDMTYTFKDLKYDSKGKKCTTIETKGTYKIENKTLTLTDEDNNQITASRNDLQSHAEIIITGVNNTELTLYRLAS